MEVRSGSGSGQDNKEMGMPLPTSFSYTSANNQLNNRKNNNISSSSKLVSSSSAAAAINSAASSSTASEGRERDQTAAATTTSVDDDTTTIRLNHPYPSSPPSAQTLDHHHALALHEQYPLLNSQPHQPNRPSTSTSRRNPDSGSATTGRRATVVTTAAANNRSSLKLPQQPPQPSAQPPAPAPAPTSTTTTSNTPLNIRYRECLKNHAASLGGHVTDGCGEFMASGEPGTAEAFKCAACECHRNFHRKEINGESQYYAPPSSYNYSLIPHKANNTRDHTARPPSQPQPQPHIAQQPTPPIAPVMMNFGGGPAESSSEDLNLFHSNNAGGGGQSSKRRFRTKFSQEQKDKMMELADKLGWRIQKQDELQVQQFCAQVGVKRQVFKVWMHNNKQAMKKKQV